MIVKEAKQNEGGGEWKVIYSWHGKRRKKISIRDINIQNEQKEDKEMDTNNGKGKEREGWQDKQSRIYMLREDRIQTE